MSTILKALRRLEQEKSTRSDRPLSEAVANTPAPPPAARTISPWLVAAGSLAAAFSVTLAVFWFLGTGEDVPPPERLASGGTPRAEESSSLPAAQRPALVRPADSARRQARAKGEATQPVDDLSAAALASEVEVVARARAPEVPPETTTTLMPPPRLEIPPQGPPRPGLAALFPRVTGIVDPVVSPGARIAALEAPTPPAAEIAEPIVPNPGAAVPAQKPPPPAPEVIAVPEPTKAETSGVVAAPKPPSAPVPEVVAAVVVAPPPAPPVPVVEAPAAEPVVSKRAAAPPPRFPEPEIFVVRTVWHPIADRRIAVIELGGNSETVELREGDMIGPLVVGKIEPSGVYFTLNGVELRRRVGAR